MSESVLCKSASSTRRPKINDSMSKLQKKWIPFALDEMAEARGGVLRPFPWRLHDMLETVANEPEDAVSWLPHGRAFKVNDIKGFTDRVLPRFFDQRKYQSFQRQLNLYGFSRFTQGPDKGGYYHPGNLFVRGKVQLVKDMVRMKTKGNKVRGRPQPELEPNYYLEYIDVKNTRNVSTPSLPRDAVLSLDAPAMDLAATDAILTASALFQMDEPLTLPFGNIISSWASAVSDDADEEDLQASLALFGQDDNGAVFQI